MPFTSGFFFSINDLEKKRNSVYHKQSFIVHQFTFMTLTITATLQGPSCWRIGISRWAPGNLEDWISPANLLVQHHPVESWFFWFSHVKNVSVFPFCHGFAPLLSSYQLLLFCTILNRHLLSMRNLFGCTGRIWLTLVKFKSKRARFNSLF